MQNAKCKVQNAKYKVQNAKLRNCIAIITKKKISEAYHPCFTFGEIGRGTKSHYGDPKKQMLFRGEEAQRSVEF